MTPVRRLGTLGIRARLLLGVVPPLLVALVLVGAQAFRAARQQVIALKQHEVAAHLERARADLVRVVEQPLADLVTLSRSALIASYHFNARFGLTEEAEASERVLRESFQHLLAVAPAYARVAYLDGSGTLVFVGKTSSALAGDLDRDLRRAGEELWAMPENAVLTPSALVVATDLAWLRYGIAVASAEGEHLGTVVLDLDFASVVHALDELANSTGGEVALLTATGDVLHRTRRGPPPATSADACADVLLVHARSIALPSSQHHERQVLRHEHDCVIGAIAPAPASDRVGVAWIVGASVPDAEFLQHILGLRRSVIFLTIVAGLVASAVCIVFLSHFAEPLRRLTAAIRRAGQGDLQVEVRVSRGDEIGAAASAFNLMLERLRAGRDELGAQIQQTERLKTYLESVIEGMASAVIVIDDHGEIRYWNSEAERQTGLGRQAVLGSVLFELDAGFEQYREICEAVLEQSSPRQTRREVARGARGRAIVRSVTCSPIRSTSVRGVVLNVEDVTSTDRIEKAMIQADKMASVGRLAAGMAHELNNPLGGIFANLENVERRLDVASPIARERMKRFGFDDEAVSAWAAFLIEQRIARHVELARECTTRASRIVQNLLDFSRSSRSSRTSERVSTLVENTLLLAQAEFDLVAGSDFRDVEVEKEVPEDLPPVFCDRQQIEQVLLNLVRNATQALAERRRSEPAFRPRLSLRASSAEGHVAIVVEDNGLGIPPELRDRVFEPFFSTKPVGEGTGLGLSISYFIVTEGNGGVLRVEDGSAGGARFVVELSAAEEAT